MQTKEEIFLFQNHINMYFLDDRDLSNRVLKFATFSSKTSFFHNFMESEGYSFLTRFFRASLLCASERGDFSLSESYLHVLLVLRGPELPPPEGRDIVVNPETECFCEKLLPRETMGVSPQNPRLHVATSYGPGKMTDHR